MRRTVARQTFQTLVLPSGSSTETCSQTHSASNCPHVEFQGTAIVLAFKPPWAPDVDFICAFVGKRYC